MDDHSLDLESICSYVVEVTKEAGKIIHDAKPTSITTITKKNSRNSASSLGKYKVMLT